MSGTTTSLWSLKLGAVLAEISSYRRLGEAPICHSRGIVFPRRCSVQVKIWLGWLDSSLVENLEETTDEAPDVVAFKDARGQSGYLPLGVSLQSLARDKFGIITGEPHAGESIDARVGQLELGIVDIKETLGEIAKLLRKAEFEPVFETADEVGSRPGLGRPPALRKPDIVPRPTSWFGCHGGLAAGVHSWRSWGISSRRSRIVLENCGSESAVRKRRGDGCSGIGGCRGRTKSPATQSDKLW